MPIDEHKQEVRDKRDWDRADYIVVSFVSGVVSIVYLLYYAINNHAMSAPPAQAAESIVLSGADEPVAQKEIG